MAVTKILARHARLDVLINYALNGDKTNERILTAYQNLTPGNPYLAMKRVKEKYHKTDGVQSYHIIQSFAPGEIRPEQALEIASRFTSLYLKDFQAVIGVHRDKEHIHAHIVFNSVSCVDGHKYHSTPQSYFEQIRGLSDRLCREYGLSVIMRGETSQAVSYSEWLKQKKGVATLRELLDADIQQAIDSAADYGHFLMLMEHMGYEIKHGKYLAFRLRGTENFIRGRRGESRVTEDSVCAAIAGSLEAVEEGLRPAYPVRKPFVPFKNKGKLKGFMALYVHYLYLLGKIKKREYPPRMTPHLRREVERFEMYREQFTFLRVNGIETPEQLTQYKADAENRLASLMKQRTIFNVQKKKQKPLFDALSAAESLLSAKELYVSGITGIEDEFARYMAAVQTLEKSGIPKEQLVQEKSELYEKLANINTDIRRVKREITLCETIIGTTPSIERDIQSTTRQQARNEVKRDEHERR